MESSKSFSHLKGLNFSAPHSDDVCLNAMSREGAILRQMTDGHHLIQLIYDASESLTDCEYVSDAETVERFQQTLADEYLRLSAISFNNTIRYVDSSSELPRDLAKMSDYSRLKKRCRVLHKKMRKEARSIGESSTR